MNLQHEVCVFFAFSGKRNCQTEVTTFRFEDLWTVTTANLEYVEVVAAHLFDGNASVNHRRVSPEVSEAFCFSVSLRKK